MADVSTVTPSMSPSEHDVRLLDGRNLRILEDGAPNGRPVLVLHGTPGSRLLYRKHVEDATNRGLRLIGLDRPGYGGSTPLRGRRVCDAAADVLSVANDLNLDRFAVWGHSGGGPHALACAALLPDRVVAAASLGSLVPYSADGIDWFEGLSEGHAAFYRRMISDPSGWEAGLVVDPPDRPPLTPEQFRKDMSAILSDVDKLAFTDELVEYFQSHVREGQRGGVAGLRDDSLAWVMPWGFELSSIRVPVQIWHGGQDLMVPYSRGEWLSTHVPHADVHLVPEDGHVTLFEYRIPAVHAWLQSHF